MDFPRGWSPFQRRGRSRRGNNRGKMVGTRFAPRSNRI